MSNLLRMWVTVKHRKIVDNSAKVVQERPDRMIRKDFL